MQRRIFIAIDLPPELKRVIADTIKQWHWLPIRWLDQSNWHITIIPPVYLEEHELAVLTSLLARHPLGGAFTLQFSRIVLAPPSSPARMIWLEGKTSAALEDLQKKLQDAWSSESGLPQRPPESRAMKLHVTLARFKPGELRELEEKTRTLGEVDLSFDVVDVAVMESHLKRSGAEYRTIRTFAV